MTKIAVNPNRGSGRFISGHLDPNKSNEAIVLAATTIVLPAGTVLGRATVGALTATPGAPVSGSGGVVGNGTLGAVTVDPGTPPGLYQVVFIDPTHFEVLKPGGEIEADGELTVAYNGSINFTGAAGGTAFAADDRIPVVVAAAAGSGSYKPYDPAAVDGSQIAAAILWHDAPISTGTQKNVATVRDAVVNGNLLNWAVAADAAQKAAAYASLAQNQVIVRQ